MKKLKVSLLPAPGGANMTGVAGRFEQHEFTVDDGCDLYIADDARWFTFEAFEDDKVTTFSFPIQRIVALALQ